MKKFIAAVIVMFSLCLLTPYNAKAEGTWSNMGYGAGSILASCVYSPAKVVYALVGGITGGMAFLVTCGNQDVAQKIWIPSLRGTYVITPEMLKGKEQVQFVGQPETKTHQPQENKVQEDTIKR